MLSILIIDDEPIAQEIIIKYSERLPALQVVQTCDNAIEGIDMIRNLNPDLVFLDIQMPEMTGIEMLRAINIHTSDVIFTTAYSEFAIDGFELGVVDYLLKPISFDRFVKAINKVQEIRVLRAQLKADGAIMRYVDDTKSHIWVKEGKKMIQIAMNNITLVEAMADYVKLKLMNEQVIIHATMARVEQLLTPPDFLRVNRSTIVRMSAIRSIEDLQIETTIPNYKRISIGSTYWDSIKGSIDLWTK